MKVKALKYLISSSSKIPTFKDRQTAELISILLLCRGFIFFAIICYTLNSKTSGSAPGVFLALLINVIAYAISRTRFFGRAAELIIIEGLILIPTFTILFESQGSVAIMPLWLGIGNLVSGLTLSIRKTVLTAIATTFDFIVIAYFIKPSDVETLLGVFLFTTSTAVLVLIGTHLRTKSEGLLELERARLIHASKFSILGEMAGGIAHEEVNTPLGAILMNAELLKSKNAKRSEPDTEVDKRAGAIIAIAERISKIISGLKSFSRESRPEDQTSVTIESIINDSFALCSEKFKSHGVHLRVIPKSCPATVVGQPIQLTQVLVNLLNNAYDSIKEQTQKWIRVEVLIGLEHIEISVIDSGSGIKDFVAEKMFTPFFTTKEIGNGTGLGLSISQSLIKNHGGDLFYDAYSLNTRFVIRLPNERKAL